MTNPLNTILKLPKNRGPIPTAATGAVAIGLVLFLYFFVPPFVTRTYEFGSVGSVFPADGLTGDSPQAKHLKTPAQVRAIYMTSWVAGTPQWRERIVELVKATELNAIVIDVKDYSGRISFSIDDPTVEQIGAAENRIPDIRDFLEHLYEEGIYSIARITVFQDPFYAKKRPDIAVQKESDKSVWEDGKGLSYIDPGAYDAWKYTAAIARGAWRAGFDELNFDYIRYPSDGDMSDIYFPVSEKRVVEDPDYGKARVVRDFFAYIDAALSDTDAPLSADLFGMVTTNRDDLNIGQVLEYAEPYFDYIAPMVYPSHFPSGFIGLENPGAHPYPVINYSMREGARRMRAASSTPDKLRPWLQDFDLSATYTPQMVRSQIEAAYDAGVHSWMLWDPANTYTRGALGPAKRSSTGAEQASVAQ